MSAPEPLAVGMYISANEGKTTGRIVGISIDAQGQRRWLIKTASGNFFTARSSALTPRG